MVTWLTLLGLAALVITLFERSDAPVPLLIQLLAAAVVGRWLFAAIPNVQPATALLVLCAVYVGWRSALMLSLGLPLLSGLLLGLGPFVLFQFLGWAIVVSTAYVLRPWLRRSRVAMVLFGLVSGFLFGWCANLAFFEITRSFIPLVLLSVPFDLAHGVGNAVFLWLLTPLFQRVLALHEPSHENLMKMM